MKHFLVQTIGDRVKHDFSFALLEAIEYQNWYFRETLYEVSFADIESMSFFDLRNLIPVGSLEFIGEYLRSFYQDMPSPLNIPEQLQTFEFLRRNVGFCNEKTIPFPSFVKSATKYKAFTSVIEKTSKPAPPDRYFWSEVVDFQSEWRAFIWNSRLVGLQHYLGDFTIFPDVVQIKKMITAYTNAPRAYTLDIGINEFGTTVIEVHPFVSCGLYGFHDSKVLPQMFIAGFNCFKGEDR